MVPSESMANVIFLHSHNTGRFVEPMGYAVPTPHLMRLARGGALFLAAARFLSGGPPEPFFRSVCLNETHRPFPAADPATHPAEDARYLQVPAPRVTTG